MTSRPDSDDPFQPLEDEDDADGGFDLQIVRDYASYAGLALRRHWLLALFCLLAIAGITGAVARVMPRTYLALSRILAQRNQVIAALGNPNRQLPSEADAPTRAARESVLRHDNVLAIIRQVNLVEEWAKTRSLPGRLADAVRRMIRGPLSREDLEEALAVLLKNRLDVSTSNEGSVTITVFWSDPEMAYRLAQAAQENFLENRHLAEISVIADSISLLEQHAAGVREAVDVAIAEYRQKRSTARANDLLPVPVARPATAPAVPAPDPELTQLALQVVAKRRAVKDLEEYRQRRIAELQAQLAEQRAVYADSHPNVVNLRQSIEAVSKESVSLVGARKEAEDLEAEYVRRAGHTLDTTPVVASSPVPLAPIEPVKVSIDAGSKVEPGEEYARQRMNAAVGRYNSLLERIDSANMELDAARAAFKYRYVVTQPPRRPKEPVAPNVPRLLAAGVGSGFALALLASVLAEVKRGVMLQPWQVKRSLGVPLLAEIGRS